MAGLLDIAPLARVVVICREADADGNPLDEPTETRLLVRGVGLDAIMEAASRFPALQAALGGAMDGGEVKSENFGKELMNSAPDAIFALISAAMGKPGDAAHETALKERLAIDELAELLETVVELSLPKGIRPFVQRLQTWLSYLPQREPAAVASNAEAPAAA